MANSKNSSKEKMEQELFKTRALARDRYMEQGKKKWADYASIISRSEKKEAFATLEFCRDTGILTQQEYYERLGALRDKHFAVGTKEWCKYTTEINDYNIKQISAAYDAIYEYAADKISSISEKQASLYKNLDGYGKLMRTVTIDNYYENGDALKIPELANLSYTNEFLKTYSKRMEEAKERILSSGIDQEAAAKLYDEMLSMKPEEASEFAHLLGNASDEQFSKYVNDYAENTRLLNEISANPFKEQWETAANEVVGALMQAGFAVPETFSGIGKDSAQRFGSDFLRELAVQMEAVKGQLSTWSFAVVPISAALEQAGGQTVYSPTYNLYGSGETDIERIRSAKAYSERERMAGGY